MHIKIFTHAAAHFTIQVFRTFCRNPKGDFAIVSKESIYWYNIDSTGVIPNILPLYCSTCTHKQHCTKNIIRFHQAPGN